MHIRLHISVFFFFNDTATTEIYTLSLHDALPISSTTFPVMAPVESCAPSGTAQSKLPTSRTRSEEHTSELQSQSNLVCRLLLEKKKKKQRTSDGPRLCRVSSRNKLCQYLTALAQL